MEFCRSMTPTTAAQIEQIANDRGCALQPENLQEKLRLRQSEMHGFLPCLGSSVVDRGYTAGLGESYRCKGRAIGALRDKDSVSALT